MQMLKITILLVAAVVAISSSADSDQMVPEPILETVPEEELKLEFDDQLVQDAVQDSDSSRRKGKWGKWKSPKWFKHRHRHHHRPTVSPSPPKKITTNSYKLKRMKGYDPCGKTEEGGCQKGKNNDYCEHNKACVHPVPSAVAPKGSTYRGCYEDKSSRYYHKAWSTYSGDKKLPLHCAQHCSGKGYWYMGLQNGNECYCGNKCCGYSKKPDYECNTGAPGLGGPWRNAIFWINQKSDLPKPPPPPPASGGMSEVKSGKPKGTLCQCKHPCRGSALGRRRAEIMKDADKCKQKCASNAQCKFVNHAPMGGRANNFQCELYKVTSGQPTGDKWNNRYGARCWKK